MQSKEPPLSSTANENVLSTWIWPGETRIASYQVLFQPEPWELTTPGEYLVRATRRGNSSRPIRITVLDCRPEERTLIEPLLPECYVAIGVRRLIALSNPAGSHRLVLPPDVDIYGVEEKLIQLETKLEHPSKLKQTLQWTLACSKLTVLASDETRRKALARILNVQKQCDPLTQEAIDASLLYYVSLERLDLALGERILRRRADLDGWPWHFDRAALRELPEKQKALKGAKPFPKAKQPLRGQLAVY
jgi:hypothetical protein